MYRANPQGIGELSILILSDDIANALRSVVVACALDPMSPEMDLRLPTYVLLRPMETGLELEMVASPASPFTLPKAALVERLGVLPRQARIKVDAAIQLVFGYQEWPL